MRKKKKGKEGEKKGKEGEGEGRGRKGRKEEKGREGKRREPEGVSQPWTKGVAHMCACMCVRACVDER